MKKLLLAAAALTALGTAPAISHADVAFNVGATTDYRYRGISQTRLKPALQGGVDFSNGGFYLGAWASTIKWVKDGGGDSNIELDLYGGYKGEVSKGVSTTSACCTTTTPATSSTRAPTPPSSTAR